MPPEKVVWIPKKEWATSTQIEKLQSIWEAPHFKLVCQALEKIGLQPLLVGGVVRDLLLDRENKDVDLIINCSPRKLMKMGSKLGKLTSATPVPLDKDRGTLRLCFSPESEVDLVALQGETLLADLANRDLRINAMAIDSEGRLADPTGGLEDLERGALQEIRSENFLQDPLRVVRALRFAAQLNFTVEDGTLQSATLAVDGLAGVAGERISTELGKFFDYAGPRHVAMLQKMRIAEALLPLDSYGWSQLNEAVAKKPVGFAVGLALLFGPSLKPKPSEPLFQRLKLSKKLQRFLTHFWLGTRKIRDCEQLGADEIFDLSRATKEAFQDFVDAVQLQTFPTALSPSSRATLLKEAEGQGVLRWDSPPWDGGELTAALGKAPGPWLGKALRGLELQWAVGGVKDFEQAVKWTRALEK